MTSQEILTNLKKDLKTIYSKFIGNNLAAETLELLSYYSFKNSDIQWQDDWYVWDTYSYKIQAIIDGKYIYITIPYENLLARPHSDDFVYSGFDEKYSSKIELYRKLEPMQFDQFEMKVKEIFEGYDITIAECDTCNGLYLTKGPNDYITLLFEVKPTWCRIEIYDPDKDESAEEILTF